MIQYHNFWGVTNQLHGNHGEHFWRWHTFIKLRKLGKILKDLVITEHLIVPLYYDRTCLHKTVEKCRKYSVKEIKPYDRQLLTHTKSLVAICSQGHATTRHTVCNIVWCLKYRMQTWQITGGEWMTSMVCV